jgi:hypothetical protein
MSDQPTSTGAQNRDEKKDHPRRRGTHLRDYRGQEDNEKFTDPQMEQAEGKRNTHAQPGKSGQTEKASGQPGKTDNTRPGGNRTKGGHHGAHQDHD